MDEVVVDGITYVRRYQPSTPVHVHGDPSVWLKNMDKNKMIEHLIEAGYLIRKEDHSIYKQGELFYEM